MKGTEVPNPRRISACDCTCVLTRLSRDSHAHSVLFQPMQSSLTNFRRSFTGRVQLGIFSFPSWFHTIWFYCSHTFHSFLSFFGSRDMITAFTCLSSYRHSSFTLRAYLCWRHTYCQWPIIELAMNVSPKSKTAASHVVQIHTRTRFPRSKKWPTFHVAVCRTNMKRSSFATKHFQRKSLKFLTFIRRREG